MNCLTVKKDKIWIIIMWKRLMNCLFKPKIKPMELTEFDLLSNKIRIDNEIVLNICESFKEKSDKIKSK